MPNPFDVPAVDADPSFPNPAAHSSNPPTSDPGPQHQAHRHLAQHAAFRPQAPFLSPASRQDSSSSQASFSEKDEAPTPPHCSTPRMPHGCLARGKGSFVDMPPSVAPALPSADRRFLTAPIEPHVPTHPSAPTPSVSPVPLPQQQDEDAHPAVQVSGQVHLMAAPASQSTGTERPPDENKAFWKVYQRTTLTFAMIGGFTTLLLLGHPYMILLVTLLAAMVYKEVVTLFNKLPSRQRALLDNRPEARKEALWDKTLSWYMFSIFNYYLYGESLVYYLKHIVYDEMVNYLPFARSHRFMSVMLYVFSFMAFILHLRRDNLRVQFSLFAWVHMSILLIVVCSHFMVNSILEGLIWFWVPASLVICNDVFGYVCGMLWGRTPLISLSPKKTREGFMGAWVITVIFGYLWGSLFQKFDYMVCNYPRFAHAVLSRLPADKPLQFSGVPCRLSRRERLEQPDMRAQPRVSLAIHGAPRGGGNNADCSVRSSDGRASGDTCTVHAVPAARDGHGVLCVPCWAVRRLLRIRV